VQGDFTWGWGCSMLEGYVTHTHTHTYTHIHTHTYTHTGSVPHTVLCVHSVGYKSEMWLVLNQVPTLLLLLLLQLAKM